MWGPNAGGGCWGDPTLPPERSRKASEGLKASGLPCWGELDSFEADERAVFLRKGRIHAGRDVGVGVWPSGRGESNGIWVTVIR